MTAYKKFKELNIAFSRLGLEPGDTHSDYICTPKGAKVIGWAGVDGIHCCFVKGFDEMVFAVNPSNPAGENVHPLAWNFEDFLRLILACGLDAAEQAWMWNRGEFDAFMETYPPGPEQQTALDGLREGMGLSPMEDPYGYIKEVQSSFDYAQLTYPKQYYEVIPQKPAAQEPPKRPVWKVYFTHHTGHDRPGKEISVNKTFTWGGKEWRIPAVYVCGKGLVVDMCMEIDPADLRSFQEKWRPYWEGSQQPTAEEQEQQDRENPMSMDYIPKLTVNGKELRRKSGNGFGWTPDSCRPESERGESQQNWEAIWLMEHYGLDPERGWMFWRDSFPWATKTKPAVKTISLSLEARPVSVSGPRFTLSGAGDSVPFTHPVTGEAHTLHVTEYETREMDMSRLGNDWEYPTRYAAMCFIVEPELPRESLTVQDAGQGDRPRPKQSSMTGPTATGSVGIIMSNSKSGQYCSACSSLYFEPREKFEWRMVFYQKTLEDIELDLPLPEN